MSDVAGIYVRQPVEVEAVRVELNKVQEISEWCDSIHTVTFRSKEHVLYVTTKRQGTIIMHVGDWIVREPDGLYRVYKAEEFKQLHIGKRFFGEEPLFDWPEYDH